MPGVMQDRDPIPVFFEGMIDVFERGVRQNKVIDVPAHETLKELVQTAHFLFGARAAHLGNRLMQGGSRVSEPGLSPAGEVLSSVNFLLFQ